MNFSIRLAALFLSLAVVTMPSVVRSAQAGPSPATYPPLKLRGYGIVSGSFTPDSAGGSLLKIACEDEARAKLVQAKYVSDLQTLPGITRVEIPVSFAASKSGPDGYQSATGVILTMRHGSTVYVMAGTSPEAVAQAADKLESSLGTEEHFVPEVEVPMYLNRFDKYSFRFYYGPFTTPDGTPRVTAYDPTQDFNFAKSVHAGMQFWHTPLSVDNAEGITNLPWTLWAVKAAHEDNIPVGINDGIEHVTWAYNRWPEQIVQYQPGFLGGWYGSMNFGEEITSWNGLEAKDHELGELQDSLRQLSVYKNITSWLEPHEEMSHGVADLLLEFGPVADKGYRAFLQEKYHSVDAVSQRWYGNATALKSWDDIHSPEVASFLGYGPEAINLAGSWKISYTQAFGAEAGSTTLDDSSWLTIAAPNNALIRFLPPRKPAVFRRHLNVDAAWRTAHPKVWLYCWDLNDVSKVVTDPNAGVQVYVNGTLLPEQPLKITQDHWVALDATRALHDGDNLIAIELPQGLFNYCVYLSPHEPLLYPNLGRNENARWVDYYDWNVWFRGNAVRRGSQMIRQVDPNGGLMLMAPNAYQESISGVAKAYGGDFHDTGSMAGSWQDDVPCLAQGMGLPATVEPGGPAHKTLELQAFFGRWITEGANAIDYFQHEGDLLWFPDRKKVFVDHLPLYTSAGKYHTATTQVAALYSMRNVGLLSFPWSGGQGYGGSDPLHLGSGQSKWNVRAPLRGDFDADSLMEASFARGDAARYKVIIDTNTSIIDPPLLAQIEKYVRDGGTFVTYVQTGRHTSLVPDSWPIEKLTGYHVTRLMQGNPWQAGALTWAKDQPVFSGDWIAQSKADGMSMQKVAVDTQDLAYWKDGSVAIGLRHLGKGAIIEVGCRFTAWGLPDRIDRDIWDYLKKTYNRLTEFGFSTDPNATLFSPELVATGKLFGQILDWQGVPRVPGQLQPPSEDGLMRHFLSNSGLYDVWVVWNQTSARALDTTLHVGVPQPKWAINLLDGSRMNLDGSDLHVHLPPYEMAIYLTPRTRVADAPKLWFDLQRRWWQGTTDAGKPFPPPDQRNARNLTDGWAFSPVPDTQTDVSAMVAPAYDDSKWTRMPIGIFSIPDFPDVHHGLLRRSFIVPPTWNHGHVTLWVRAWDGQTFLEHGVVYLDGKLLRDCGEGGLEDELASGTLTPGSTHLLAIDITGPQGLVGSRGPAWIAYHPDPVERQALSGPWETSTDGLHWQPPVPLPGTGQFANRCTVKIPGAQSSRTVVFHARNGNGVIRGVIINGRFVARHHHNVGPEINLAITPWVKFGQDNTFILLGSDNVEVKEVSLEFHAPGTYP